MLLKTDIVLHKSQFPRERHRFLLRPEKITEMLRKVQHQLLDFLILMRHGKGIDSLQPVQVKVRLQLKLQILHLSLLFFYDLFIGEILLFLQLPYHLFQCLTHLGKFLETAADLRHLPCLTIPDAVHGIRQLSKRLYHLPSHKLEKQEHCHNRKQREQKKQKLPDRGGLPQFYGINGTDPEIHIGDFSAKHLIIRLYLFQHRFFCHDLTQKPDLLCLFFPV